MENDTKILEIRNFILFLESMALISIALLIQDPILGILALLLTAYSTYASYRKVAGKNEEFADHLEHINQGSDQLAKYTISSMPFPPVIADDQGKIYFLYISPSPRDS